MQPFDNSLLATWNPSNSYGVKANLRSNIEESYALNYLPTATSRDWPIYAEHSGREAANWHSRSGRAIGKTWIRCWARLKNEINSICLLDLPGDNRSGD